MVEVATMQAPPLSRLRPDLPRRLCDLVHRALASDLSDRTPDMTTFMRTVSPALASKRIASGRMPSCVKVSS
jgi:hypothetical protein